MNVNVKRTLKFISKILILALIIYLVFSNTNLVFAGDDGTDPLGDAIGGLLDGIVGILLLPLKLTVVLLGGAMQLIAGLIAKIDGGSTRKCIYNYGRYFI